MASVTLTLLSLVWINMALQPCLMAAEPLLPEQHHESGCPHCPPMPERHCGGEDTARCAYFDSIDFDGRQAATPDVPDLQPAATPAVCNVLIRRAPERHVGEAGGPPPETGPPIFLRDCRFLK